MTTTPPEALRELGAEFHSAADRMSQTLDSIEWARQSRLTFLRRCVTENTDRLAKLKEELRTLPEQIAKWEAERAHLEAQTGLDLLRAVVTERVKCGGNHAGPPCADRECWNPTRAEVEAMADARESRPALLDLRGLKVGTVCEAQIAIRRASLPSYILEPGERFEVADEDPTTGNVLIILPGGQRAIIEPLQPARVVEEPKGESDG